MADADGGGAGADGGFQGAPETFDPLQEVGKGEQGREQAHQREDGNGDEIEGAIQQGAAAHLEALRQRWGFRQAALVEAQRAGRLAVDEVALYGAQLHVIAPEVMAHSQVIREVLAERGLQPGPMDVIMPSLEDVFISATREGTENRP